MPSNGIPEDKVVVSTYIDRETKVALRVECAREGVSMSAKVAELIDAYVQEKETRNE